MCVEKIGKGLKIFSFNFSTGGGGGIVEKSVEKVDKFWDSSIGGVPF